MGERTDEPTYTVSWAESGRLGRVSLTYRRQDLWDDLIRLVRRRDSGEIDNLVVINRIGVDVTVDFFG